MVRQSTAGNYFSAGILADAEVAIDKLVGLVGQSDAMRRVFALIQGVAASAASVFITGESGTGKELAARAVHKLSPRGNELFVAINCAALPETLIESELFGHESGAFTGATTRRSGCFQQAHRGTLLLDEITEMPLGTQAKLLRVLQDGRVRPLGASTDVVVDVRVIAATNRLPEEAVQDKHLREDLYYRINVFQIRLPPLRSRKEDIPALVDALVADLNQKHDCRVTNVEPEALSKLMSHSWPGNVRELRNILERATIVAREGALKPQHFSVPLDAESTEAPVQDASRTEVQFGYPSGATLREMEQAYILYTLAQTGNNKRQTAKILDICERTLYSRLAK